MNEFWCATCGYVELDSHVRCVKCGSDQITAYHGRTYRVICCSNSGERQQAVIETGLSRVAAFQLRDARQKQADREHPERSSWTRDIFLCELETGDAGRRRRARG